MLVEDVEELKSLSQREMRNSRSRNYRSFRNNLEELNKLEDEISEDELLRTKEKEILLKEENIIRKIDDFKQLENNKNFTTMLRKGSSLIYNLIEIQNIFSSIYNKILEEENKQIAMLKTNSKGDVKTSMKIVKYNKMKEHLICILDYINNQDHLVKLHHHIHKSIEKMKREVNMIFKDSYPVSLEEKKFFLTEDEVDNDRELNFTFKLEPV